MWVPLYFNEAELPNMFKYLNLYSTYLMVSRGNKVSLKLNNIEGARDRLYLYF